MPNPSTQAKVVMNTRHVCLHRLSDGSSKKEKEVYLDSHQSKKQSEIETLISSYIMP